METIKTYLDNMFGRLPRTQQVLRLRENILANMEDKYNELKNAGRSEHEAIGIVISEFGNIDELIQEMGITIPEDDPASGTNTVISDNEIEDYLQVKQSNGLMIGLGVCLCILGVALLILITQLTRSDVIGVCALLTCIAIAVGLFIYSDVKSTPYEYIENGVTLSVTQTEYLKLQFSHIQNKCNRNTIIAVPLFVISPITLLVSNSLTYDYSDYGIVIMLLLIAIGIFLLITSSTIREGYELLLGKGDDLNKIKAQKNGQDAVISVVATIVWPLAVVIFLIIGFIFHGWHYGWLVFPITGILYGGFCAAYTLITAKDY